MKMTRRDARRERKLVTAMVGVCAAVVVIATGMNFYFSPEQTATRELERITREYYEDYLYEDFVAALEAGSAEGLAEFTESGMEPVKLRHLLLYDGGKNKALMEVFDNAAYRCDMDQTTVTYYPVEPYGAKDYTVKYETFCKK